MGSQAPNPFSLYRASIYLSNVAACVWKHFNLVFDTTLLMHCHWSARPAFVRCEFIALCTVGNVHRSFSIECACMARLPQKASTVKATGSIYIKVLPWDIAVETLVE